MQISFPRIGLFFSLTILLGSVPPSQADAHKTPEKKIFRAGAYAVDITPQKFPVIVNGNFQEGSAQRAQDPLFARCLVLDDGATRIALVVVDSCMLPREFLDKVKVLARETTGIATEHMLISATHTHSAPSLMGLLGSRQEADYGEFLQAQIVRGLQLAVKELQPARVGWNVVTDAEHTFCRRWIYRPDRMLKDPFGGLTVRANMHPGHQSANAVGPAGPVDPGISLLSVRTPAGKPIALLANYSMHYFGAAPVSADYFGRFNDKIGKLIEADASFVAMMSQGTSGDLMWKNYARPDEKNTIDAYADAVARAALAGYKQIEYRDWAPLAMRETKRTFRRRTPDAKRLEWARPIVASVKDRQPKTLPEIYAFEQIFLHEEPVRELKLQALRIGALGITAIPNEVFGITGLKIKAQSPLQPTFNIELANGAEGYIPPPEQHALGGYTTWPARSAGLEVKAEPEIVEAVLGLLEQVADQPRRKLADSHGPYAHGVLQSKPVAYWRMNEFTGPARDATGNAREGTFAPGIAYYLEGPRSPSFSEKETSNRAVHFAGGSMKTTLKDLGDTYSVELWFWNGLPSDARAVTGYLFARGDGATDSIEEQLGIGGTQSAAGRIFFSGAKANQVLAGPTEIGLKTWNHVVLARAGKKVVVYLNGNEKPEIAEDATESCPANLEQLVIGGRSNKDAGFEGKLDEIAVYNRALTAAEAARHYKLSEMGLPEPKPAGAKETPHPKKP